MAGKGTRVWQILCRDLPAHIYRSFQRLCGADLRAHVGHAGTALRTVVDLDAALVLRAG
jgi:hypothetical protein